MFWALNNMLTMQMSKCPVHVLGRSEAGIINSRPKKELGTGTSVFVCLGPNDWFLNDLKGLESETDYNLSFVWMLFELWVTLKEKLNFRVYWRIWSYHPNFYHL